MPNFLVSILYDNGPAPTHYIVENVQDHRAARKYVRTEIIGYDPGVWVEITQVPINENKPLRYPNLGGAD